MGAHPKNKITSVERGKRRAGNTPKLKRDHNVVSIPLHKRGLVASILRKIGVTTPGATPEVESEKKHVTDQQAVAGQAPVAQKTAKPAPQSVPKATVKRTQHKG